MNKKEFKLAKTKSEIVEYLEFGQDQVKVVFNDKSQQVFTKEQFEQKFELIENNPL